MIKRVIVLLILAAAGGAYYRFYYLPEAAQNGVPRLYGNVDIREVRLGFRVAGRIADIRIEEGDTVHKGDTLAVLDQEPFLHELNAMQASLAQASANLARLEAGPRAQEIAQARARVAEIEAVIAGLEKERKRREGLIDSGAVSEQSYDDLTARGREAQARLEGARQALALAEEGYRSEDIDAARAARDAAAAALDAAQTRFNDTTLVAPSDGVVLTRVEEPGAVVTAGQPVFSVSVIDPVWVRAYIAEPQLGLIHPGMPVDVLTDSRPGLPYKGHVGFISPEAEFTPKAVQTEELRTALVYRIRVIVDDPDQGLRKGMPVTVRLPTVAAKTEGAAHS